MGSQQHELEYWEKKLVEFNAHIIHACSYDDTQVALLFLTKCVSTQLNYYSRLTDPSSLAGQLDEKIDEALCNGLNILLKKNHITTTDNCWIQARLAAKHGGLGIQSPIMSHPGAYLSSLVGCYSTLKDQLTSLTSADKLLTHRDTIQSVLALLNTSMVTAYATVYQHSVDGGSELEPLSELLEGNVTKLQKKLNAHVSNNFYNQLRSNSSTADKVRLDSCSEEGSVLVSTMPKTDDLSIEAELFLERLCTRLGESVPYIKAGECQCGRGYSGSDGLHLQSQCLDSSKQKTNTHDKINKVWYKLGLAAGYRCRMECTIIFADLNVHTDRKFRMDTVIECYDGTKPLLIDVSVTDPRCLDTKPKANGSERKEYSPGEAGRLMEEDKFRKYHQLSSADCVFKPVVFESLGRWATLAREVFKHLVERVHIRSGVPKHVLYPLWRAQLCFAMHKTAAEGLRYRSDAQDLLAQQMLEELREIDHDAYGVVKANYYNN